MASALWRLGLRYLTDKGYTDLTGERLAGSPDLVFPKKRLVIFMDGCFWHGCLKCRRLPDNANDFWKRKIEANRERDLRANVQL